MKSKTTIYLALITITLLSFQISPEEYTSNWPNWRGANSDGVSLNGTPPTEWSETNNVKWKTPIPGKGIGTPVVWGDQIFITTAIELDKEIKDKVTALLAEQTKGEIELSEEVSKDLIGGFVLSYDDKQYDASIKKQIKELRRDFDKNLYIREF